MRSLTLRAALLLLSALLPAQDLAIARAAARIDTDIAWITDGFHATDPGRPVAALPKTGVDRGALLDQALKRAADEQKPVLWYIPRIEGGHMVRPEFLDTYMRVVAFTDGGLTDLIRHRFVPLRMAVDGPIAKRTGITKLEWVEPAIVILHPDGRILHRLDRIRTFDAGWFRSWLVSILGAHPERFPVPDEIKAAVDRAVKDTDKALGVAGWAWGAGYDAGADVIADALIRDPTSSEDKAQGLILKARLRAERRDRAGATELLRQAEAAGNHPFTKSEVALERGRLALGAGEFSQASGLLTSAAADYPDDDTWIREMRGKRHVSPWRAEALSLLAISQILTHRTQEAESTFREVVSEFGGTDDGWRYAAIAAANLLKGRDTTYVGPAFHGFIDPVWFPEAAFAESRPNTAWPRPPAEMDDVVKRGVAWLLRHQGENGGFEDSRYAYCDSPRILPNVWVAITAIALAGLHDWREVDPTAIDAAIKRGEEYLFNPANVAPGRNEQCYADSFRLIYLTRLLARLPADSERAAGYRARLKEIASSLVDQQSESGWLAHEYPNPFATAAGLVALHEAKTAGTAVPNAFFERGGKAIRSVRGEDGVFAYSSGRTGAKTETAFRSAMGRMPVCEQALLCCAPEGAADTAPLEAALDNFWKWLPRLERIRVCDFHADGELGGFFFWHALFLTSESIEALPPGQRAAHHQKMLEHVMSIGEIDGAFVDSHELGKSYGTGMALMVLRNSSKRPE